MEQESNFIKPENVVMEPSREAKERAADGWVAKMLRDKMVKLAGEKIVSFDDTR